jgi:hypothetical protein
MEMEIIKKIRIDGNTENERLEIEVNSMFPDIISFRAFLVEGENGGEKSITHRIDIQKDKIPEIMEVLEELR